MTSASFSLLDVPSSVAFSSSAWYEALASPSFVSYSSFKAAIFSLSLAAADSAPFCRALLMRSSASVLSRINASFTALIDSSCELCNSSLTLAISALCAATKSPSSALTFSAASECAAFKASISSAWLFMTSASFSLLDVPSSVAFSSSAWYEALASPSFVSYSSFKAAIFSLSLAAADSAPFCRALLMRSSASALSCSSPATAISLASLSRDSCCSTIASFNARVASS